MSNSEYDKALAESLKLEKLSEDALFEQLGLRIQDAINNPGGWDRSKDYTGDFAQAGGDMLSFEDLKKIGHKWWYNFEGEMISILCTPGNDDLKSLTNGKTIPQVAAGLATAGIAAALATPPAWVIIGTTLLATKLAETGLDALCEVWVESRSEENIMVP